MLVGRPHRTRTNRVVHAGRTPDAANLADIVGAANVRVWYSPFTIPADPAASGWPDAGPDNVDLNVLTTTAGLTRQTDGVSAYIESSSALSMESTNQVTWSQPGDSPYIGIAASFYGCRSGFNVYNISDVGPDGASPSCRFRSGANPAGNSLTINRNGSIQSTQPLEEQWLYMVAFIGSSWNVPAGWPGVTGDLRMVVNGVDVLDTANLGFWAHPYDQRYRIFWDGAAVATDPGRVREIFAWANPTPAQIPSITQRLQNPISPTYDDLLLEGGDKLLLENGNNLSLED